MSSVPRVSRPPRVIRAWDRIADMPGDRLRRILAELSDGERPVAGRPAVRGRSRSIAGVNGAGVMLMSGDIPRGSLCTS